MIFFNQGMLLLGSNHFLRNVNNDKNCIELSVFVVVVWRCRHISIDLEGASSSAGKCIAQLFVLLLSSIAMILAVMDAGQSLWTEGTSVFNHL